MAENNQQPRRRIPWSYIFSFLVVIGIIVTVLILLFGNNSAKTFTQTEFVDNLGNNRITNVTQTPKEQSITIISGYYTPKGAAANTKKKYVVRIDWEQYASPAAHLYTDEATGNKLPLYDPEGDGVANSISLREYLTLNAEGSLGPNVTPIQLNSVTDPYEVSWWDQWGPTIIMLAGSLLIFLLLFGRLSASVNGSNNKALEFNKSRARRETKSKIRFADVAGADEEKTEMQELVYYLKDPKRFTKFGAKLPKGVLLVGPPGCGKTLLAKAVAGEAGVPFFSISGSDFVEMFVGVGAGRVRDMFRVAKENAPCLVFIDEIDAVGRQRGAGLGGGNDEREQTLNQLLVEMDGFNDNSGIIVIAATNRDDVLDPALLRAGRFDRKITVSLPDKKGREAIFKVHSRNKKLDDDVNFENLAKRTVGFSGADIENIMNEAAILAVRANRESISIDDIDEAIDRRVAGPAKSSRSLTAHEKEMIAYHESGHAIIGLKYPHSNKVQKITIIPRGNTGGHVRMTPEDDKFTNSKSELIAEIVGFMGGRASEETFCDDISNGASNDIQVATAIARAMVCEWGMSDLGPIQYERDTGSVFLGRDYTNTQKNFSVETATKIDNEIRKIIDFAHAEALRVIKENKDDVILLAKTLIEHEQITAEEIDYLLEHRHLKRDEVAPAPQAEAPAEEVKPSEPSEEGDNREVK